MVSDGANSEGDFSESEIDEDEHEDEYYDARRLQLQKRRQKQMQD